MVGCGAVARAAHLPLLARAPGALVVAAADPSASARAAAARLVPGAELHDDPHAVLTQRDVDAVVICAPSGVHAELALAALAAGKHLYLEKPLATTQADGERVVEAARAAGVVAAIGFNRRFHPVFVDARRAVSSGSLGRVHTVRTAFHEPIAGALPEWKRRRQSGGGALLDLASHHVDLLRFLLGGEVELRAATIASLASEHDRGELRLGIPGGGEAVVAVSFHGRAEDVVVLEGERGTVRADRHAGPRIRLRRRRDPSYGLALRAFVDRVRGTSVAALPTLEDGLRSLEIVLRAEGIA